MDEFVRRKGLWIGLAVLGTISLCVVMCVAAAFLALRPRETVTYAPVPYVAPQAGEEGAAPQVYQAPVVSRHGGLGLLGIVGFGFRLFFFGLLILLGLRLLGRLFWGPRHYWAPYCGPRHWGAPYYHGQPPTGATGEPPAQGQGEAGWGPPPWSRGPWRHHHHHWGPPPWWGPYGKQAGEQAKPAEGESEYTGPQE